MADASTDSAAGWSVAIIGATGAIGREIATLLRERGTLAVRRVDAYASQRSEGDTLDWREGVAVRPWTGALHAPVDVVFLATPLEAAREIWATWSDRGVRVVDLTGHRGPGGDAPLVVPEVSADDWRSSRIVASPMGPVAPMALVTEALLEVAVPTRLTATLFMAASSKGQRGMEALAGQTTALLNQKEVPVDVFPQRLAFNLIPDVDGVPERGGASRAESRFEAELRAVLDEGDLDVVCSAIRVPLFSGQAASAVWEFGGPVDAAAVRAALVGADGVDVVDDPAAERYPLAGNVSEINEVQVGRIRVAGRDRNLVSAWVVSDNLRKGGALNAVQIAERWWASERS